MNRIQFQRAIFFIILFGCVIASVVAFVINQMNASTALNVIDRKVDLTPLGEDWANLCILGPYSTNEIALNNTGLNVDIDGRSVIGTNDGIALLITLDERGEYRLFEIPRRPSDFTSLSGECWPRGVDFRITAEGHPFVLRP